MQIEKQDSGNRRSPPNPYQEMMSLPRTGRTLLVGMTGGGKTTLKTELCNLWLRRFTNGRLLIIDSKPRYRAHWQVNGLLAAPLYRKWRQDPDAFMSGSYVIPLYSNYKKAMDMAYKHTRIVIAQGGMEHWDELLEVARIYYEEYSAKSGPRLMDVDELADFWEVKKIGGILWQCLRSGREVGVGMVCGTQRPRYIPKTVITESDRLYLFKLKSEEDVKSLYKEFGLPKDVVAPTELYQFRFYDCLHKGYPNGELFQLAK